MGIKYKNKNFDKPYEWDLDKNNFPKFTQKNECIAKFLIDNDSNYRIEGDEFDSSTKKYVQKVGETTELKELIEIATRIDRQNSTHQASEGLKGGGNGREKTAKYIKNRVQDLYDRLKSGDPNLVNEIAKALLPGRYTFSFASKFCTYVSRYLYKSDEYCIYDKVLCNALPYYAWVYLGEKYIAINSSKIETMFAKKDKGNYQGYRKLIDNIRVRSKQHTRYDISREGFDSIVWYYFKGGKDLYDENNNCIFKSRITESLEHVGKENSKLFSN